jgi:hypothetical protein
MPLFLTVREAGNEKKEDAGFSSFLFFPIRSIYFSVANGV